MVDILIILAHIIVNLISDIFLTRSTLSKKDRDELLEMLSQVVDLLSDEERKFLFRKAKTQVPLSIFSGKLSGLESVVVYLKDRQGKRVKDIAKILNRKLPTIYATYSNAKRKKGKLDCSGELFIPLSIFSNRRISILESLVSYLRDEEKLTLIQIAKILNKAYGTIKTVYWRYNKKCH